MKQALTWIVSLVVAAAVVASCGGSGGTNGGSASGDGGAQDGTTNGDSSGSSSGAGSGSSSGADSGSSSGADSGSGGGMEAGADAAVDAQSDAAADGGTGDGASTFDAGDTGAVALLHELDPCASSSQCASPLVCAPLVQNGATRCTRPCTATSECMTGTVCTGSGGSQKLCAWGDVGKACSASSDCWFGCQGQQYCTEPCNTGADCPNGYGCMALGTPPTRVCVRAEAACDSGNASACLSAAFCDTSAALFVGGCTTLCSTASDCPQRAAGFASWSCDVASGGLCRRPSDVTGPLPVGFTPAQYACNGTSMVVNLCNDDQHIDFAQLTAPSPPAVSCLAVTPTSGAPDDSCVDSCRYQGACPFGYACSAIGSNAGNRIGLCFPALGTGEVGAACASSAQCFFGLCDNLRCSRDCTADGLCPTGSTCTAGGGPSVEGQPFRKCE